MMPLGALLMALFIGYEMKMKSFSEEVTLEGNKFVTRKFFTACIMVIAPLAMIFILLGQLQSFGIINLPFLR
ncbi:MAG: hypothetical protein GX823_01230 [Clostridiales bacterium]|nr:hypothetical protein [Clostridiales bacterium]